MSRIFKYINLKFEGKGTKGYDCVVIPGAAKGTMCEDFTAANLNANRFCGNSAGLPTKTAATNNAMNVCANCGTVCSKLDLMIYFNVAINFLQTLICVIKFLS